MDNLISLKGGDTYITKTEANAYKVTEGTVLVYVVPLKNGKPGRRSFIYQAETNEVLPGFAYKDIEYCEWRFCFVAVDSAKLSVIENGSTKVLKERFSKKARIKNYAKEGYQGALVDQYRINIVTEDGFIRRTQHQREDTASNILGLILKSFKKQKFNVAETNSNNLFYNAISILCNTQKVSIAPYEKMKEACGDKFNVSDIARISHFAYREIVLNPRLGEGGRRLLRYLQRQEEAHCLPDQGHPFLYAVGCGEQLCIALHEKSDRHPVPQGLYDL